MKNGLGVIRYEQNECENDLHHLVLSHRAHGDSNEVDFNP